MEIPVTLSLSFTKAFIAIFFCVCVLNILRILRGETPPSNKTQALTKGMNLGIWEIGTLKQLFIRRSYPEINFSKE